MRVTAWLRVLSFAAVTLAMALVAGFGRVVLAPFPTRSARFASSCCRTWCRAGTSVLGVGIRLAGPVPTGTFVAAANHLSYLDILVLGSLWPGVFVAKREIRGWPLFGLAAGAAGTLFIDRESPREIVAVGRRMAEALARGLSVTLFPEGRITDGSSVLPFQPPLFAGPARDGVPCHAVCLRYETSEPGIDPGTQICWPTDAPLLEHVLRVAGMRDLTVTVAISDEAVVSDDRKELARRLHEWVSGRFRPMTAGGGASSCAR